MINYRNVLQFDENKKKKVQDMREFEYEHDIIYVGLVT